MPRDLPPAGLELPKGVKLADSLVFRNASVRDIFTAIGHFADINVVFDPQFRDATVTDRPAQDARSRTRSRRVTASTRNFYKISAAKTITVIPDTPAKRREYEDEIIQTFYLSNADVKETLDVLRLVVDNRRLSPVAGVNAIAIKDTPEKIAAAARVISAIDKARAEVVIDVELLEVDRSRMHEFGLQLASPGDPPSAGISGNVDANRSDLTLRDLRTLSLGRRRSSPACPRLYYRLLKTDGSTRTLANPQLRTSDGMASTARFGEDVPVPSVTFAPIASGGVNQQPITSFTYRTIGVNIELTPRLHHNDDISLRLKLEVSSLSGVGFNNLPTFGTRFVETTIRLRDGETNMLAGLIRDEERNTLQGHSGAERPAGHRPAVRGTPQGDQADRHRADADAADHPRARSRSRRPAPVPRRPRLRPAASTSCRCRRSSRCRPPRRRTTTAPPRPTSSRRGRRSDRPARSGRSPRRRRRVRRRRRRRRRRLARPARRSSARQAARLVACNSHFGSGSRARRPAGQARGARKSGICQRRATPPGGMPRPGVVLEITVPGD